MRALFTNYFWIGTRKEEGRLLAGRRALHSYAPHCCDLIGRELPGAEIKLVELARRSAVHCDPLYEQQGGWKHGFFLRKTSVLSFERRPQIHG